MDLANWAGLAAATFAAAVLYAISGFGFAVLAAPLYLLFVVPSQSIQLVIIVSTALSLTVLPGLRRAAAWGLLMRLTIGAIAELPIGLFAFPHADPLLVRLGVGATILSFALVMAVRRRRAGRPGSPLATSPGRDLSAGAVAGVSTCAGRVGRTARADLLATGRDRGENRPGDASCLASRYPTVQLSFPAPRRSAYPARPGCSPAA